MEIKNRISGFKLLVGSYSLVIIGLFIYSFTQVDLDLTLSRWSVWQVAEKFFQHIGYFNRPLSTAFYIIILVLLCLFYILFLYYAASKKLTKRGVWTLVIFMTIVLAFSYNAFSYDLFNYIFDARIITHYHQNPYFHKALDYPGDPMLSFMHWTHRTYPYGPFWLFLTVPLSFLGFGFFLPTFFLFKFLMAASFLLSNFLIEKISEKAKTADSLFALVFFAFNPLVIIESLVSAHNDIVMMSFALLSIYLLLQSKRVFSFLSLFLSIALKFATAFILPIYILAIISGRRGKSFWNICFIAMSILMSMAVVVASERTNFQPWYLLYVFPFISLISNSYFIIIFSVTASFVFLLEYVPFLYLGNWNPPVPSILLSLTYIGVGMSVLFTFIWFIIKIKLKKE